MSSTASRSPAASPRRTGDAGRRQSRQPRGVAGSGPAHPGLEHPPHLVAIQQPGEAGHVVLVRVCQDHGVDPTIPRRDPLVQHDEEPARVRSAIDQQSSAARTLDQDGVTLSDIEDADPRDAGRAADDDRTRDHDGDGQHHERDLRRAGGVVRRHAPGWARAGRSAVRRHVLGRATAATSVVRRPPQARSAATPSEVDDRDREEGRDRQDGGDLAGQGHARERQTGHRIDDRDHDPQQDPAGCGKDGARRSPAHRPAPGTRRASR